MKVRITIDASEDLRRALTYYYGEGDKPADHATCTDLFFGLLRADLETIEHDWTQAQGEESQ